MMDDNWIEYKCNSGETLFIYNKVTGEHKWPHGLEQGIEYRIIYGHPVTYKEFSSTATQTDENCCRCRSMYIDMDPSHVSNAIDAALPQQQPVDSDEKVHSNNEHGLNISLNHKDHLEASQGPECQNVALVNSYKNNEVRNSDHNENTWTDRDDHDLNQELLEVSEMLKDLEQMNFSRNSGLSSENNTCAKSGTVDLGVCTDNDGREIGTSDDHFDSVGCSGDYNGCYGRDCDVYGNDVDVEHGHIPGNDRVTNADNGKSISTHKDPGDVAGFVTDMIDKSAVNGTVMQRQDARDTNLTAFMPSNVVPRLYYEKDFGENFLHQLDIATPANQIPYQCLVCRKQFSSKSSLNTHIKIHTEVKPFECSVCEKKFCQKENLVIHVRTHTGEKPFGCSVCKKKFSQRGNLTTHMRTHTGEKPFECCVCKKKFSQKGNLVKHMATHTEEIPFKCSLCRKAFTYKYQLVSHVKIHKGENPYQCFVCKKTFIDKRGLKEHFRQNHKD